MGREVLNDSTLGRVRLSERGREVLCSWFQTESKELVGERIGGRPDHGADPLAAGACQVRIGGSFCAHQIGFSRAVEDGLLSVSEL